MSCDRPVAEVVEQGDASHVELLARDQLARMAQRPEDAQGYLELGMLYDQNSRPALAVEAYEDALRWDASNARALYHLGRMREVLGDLPGALQAFESCVELASDAVMAHARLGDLQLSTGELDAARASFARALDLDGHHPAGPEGLARVALAEGQAAVAVDVLKKFLLQSPERGHARFLLGTAYRSLGRLDEARVQLELSEGSSPAVADPWLEETKAYLAGYHGVMQRVVERGTAGEADQIVEFLEVLRREYPDDVTALEKLVAAQLQLGRPGDAIAALDDFLQRTPDHSRAWFLRALALEAKGDLGAAEVAIARSIAGQSDWVPAHELAARVSWRRNDLPQAVESLERALYLGGPKLNTMLKLARALQLVGDSQEARKVLRAASEAFPLNAAQIQAAAQGLPPITEGVGDGL